MSKDAKDPMGEARLLLAGIEADIRTNHDKLKQLRTAGADHFQHRLEWAQQRGLNESNVDAWCREASAVGKVRGK